MLLPISSQILLPTTPASRNKCSKPTYLFILAVTKLEERYGDSSESILWEILDNYHLNPNAYDKQVAFAAFYNLAVHYYRTYETDNLRKLISDQLYYTTFYQDFPIINEAIARYCIITSMYDRQLVLARLTLQKFKEFAKLSEEERTLKSGYVQTFDNVALKVTFASALCSIFEHCFLKGQLGKPADGQSTSKITLDNPVPPEKLEEFIKREQSLSYNLSDIIPEYVTISNAYIDDAINYNPSYPKYYYFKARIIFFGTLFNGNKIDKDTYEQISNYLSTAKSKENSKASDYDVRCSIYDRFNSLVQDYYEDGASDAYDGGLYYQQKQMEIINMNVCPDHQNRPKITAGPGDKYAFISYSTQNFKRVYCDIYEMQRLGIQYWYDAETIPSEKWDEIVEEKIKNALCVICYLSVDFILSASILKELNFIRKYNKPIICIDLTGKKQISKIFADIMRNQPLSVVNTINSQKINAFMNAFDDDVDVISRNSDPASVYHVKRLEGVMVKKYAEAVRNVVTEGATWKNNKTFKNTAVIKPNEDYYVLNDANRIYTVVDGISRTEEDYLGPQPNSAHNVSKIFCEQFTQNLSSLLPWCNSVKVLQNYVKDAFIYANERVLDYLESIKESYKNKEIPGCVGIVSVIYNQRLVFGCFGDCM